MANKKAGGKNKSGDTVGKNEDGIKGNRAKSMRGNAAEDKKTKSNLADEGSGQTRRYSTRRGGTVDVQATGETSGPKKIGKNVAKGKRKLEGRDSEMVQTPAKKRKADQKEAEAFASSNEKSSYSFRTKRAIPCFRKVDLSDSEFGEVVGKRVRVFRSDSKELCIGRIESYNRRKKQHKVLYSDGKSGELDMKTQQFELERKPGEAYNFKDGSTAAKGKSVVVEDAETKESQSKLKKEITSSVSKRKSTRAEKGKAIATDMNKVGKVKVRDSEPPEKIIKLGEPMRAVKARGFKSQKNGSANDEKTNTVSRKTKKAGDEANVDSRKNPVRNMRTNVRTRN